MFIRHSGRNTNTEFLKSTIPPGWWD